jgi:lipoprotein-anchoring transpeptidase ErfK/SrfK
VKRAAAFAALLACAFAGLFAASLLSAPVAGADDGTGTETTATDTTTDTTVTTTTETTTTTTTTPKPPKPPRGPRLIPAGVTVGGTLVGGLTRAEAQAIVTKRFARKLPLVVSPSLTIAASPEELGAAAQVRKAIARAALVRRPNVVVPLTVEIWESRLAKTVDRLQRRLRRDPVDARIRLVRLRPEIVPSVPGRRLMRDVALREIRLALRTHRRDPLALSFRSTPAKLTEAEFDHTIVIRRESKKLFLYDGAKLKRVFRVATGQASYPTPIGKFEIIVKQRNPWWYPPAGSAWAEGADPVPPGPGNPLGTRWMGISSPYVGIHGTFNAWSIGYSASHGCVRMLIPEVEWLFERVDVGTPVFIVRA